MDRPRSLVLVALAAAALALASVAPAAASDSGVAAAFQSQRAGLEAAYQSVLRGDAAYFRRPFDAGRQRTAITRLRRFRVVVEVFHRTIHAQAADTPLVREARTRLLRGLTALRVALGRGERSIRALDLRRSAATSASYGRRLRLGRRLIRAGDRSFRASVADIRAAGTVIGGIVGAAAPPSGTATSVVVAGDLALRDAAIRHEDALAAFVRRLDHARAAAARSPRSVRRMKAVVVALGALDRPLAAYQATLGSIGAESPAARQARVILRAGNRSAHDGYVILRRGYLVYIRAIERGRRRSTLAAARGFERAFVRIGADTTSFERHVRLAERRCDRGLQLLGLVRRGRR